MLSAYTSKFSYFNNENINLKINSTNSLSSVKIYKFSNLNIVYTDNCKERKNYKQETNKSKYLFIDGYGWVTNYIINLKQNYYPGLYFIELRDIKGNFYYLPINIKNKYNSSNNLVLLNSNTWNAYNETGGASFYRYHLNFESKYGPLQGSKKFPKNDIGCTFDRPFDTLSENISFYIKNNGEIKEKYDHLLYGELRLLKFMEINNIKYDLLDDIDLHNNLVDISKYNNFILNCHPEYWSMEMLNNVKVNANNIISLAGNVAYRKVRYKDNIIYGRIGLFKKKDLENITGSYFDIHGADTYAPYKIFKPTHILFKGVNNTIFGKHSYNNYKRNKEDGISGHETDKKIESVKTQILASGLNTDRNKKNNKCGGDILYFTIKKTNSLNTRNILSVGSIVFTGGLFIDKDTEMFCKNVFNRFSFNKIFVFAYTKTGSTSMSRAFSKLGLNVAHISYKDNKQFCKNITDKKPIFTNVEYYDGIVLGESNYILIDQIYKDYPNSKYIYLDRDNKEWLLSYKRHQLVQKRILKDDTFYLDKRCKVTKIFFDFMKEKKENILKFNIFNGDSYNKIIGYIGFDFKVNEDFIHANNSLQKFISNDDMANYKKGSKWKS